MKRTIRRAQILAGREAVTLARLQELTPAVQQRIADEQLLTISLFRWQRNLFLYCEYIREEIPPAELFSPLEELLEPWPARSKAAVGADDGGFPLQPAGERGALAAEAAAGKTPRQGRADLAGQGGQLRLLSLPVAGGAGLPGGKYQFIGLHENMLFLYDELPQVREPLVHEKGLKTTGTPANWEDSRMDLHFIPGPTASGTTGKSN